jgi:uncharacterized protein YbjT (DUF2867 family)
MKGKIERLFFIQMKNLNVFLAGATGYLGGYILKQLVVSGYKTKIIVRDRGKVQNNSPFVEIIEGLVTRPDSLDGLLDDMDVVISTVGITRQKDGLTYMDVDYMANRNLLHEAKKSRVRKFIYISALNAVKLRHLKILEAKERFVDELKASGIEYAVIRPNGFFSDMSDFLTMAKGGKVYLFGKGDYKINPIHGADLAEVCVEAIHNHQKEIDVGGPDILSQNEIAEMALRAWSKKTKIVHLPDWIRKMIIWLSRTFTSSKTYGPIEFFLTLMAIDNVAPKYGKHQLAHYFNKSVSELSAN